MSKVTKPSILLLLLFVVSIISTIVLYKFKPTSILSEILFWPIYFFTFLQLFALFIYLLGYIIHLMSKFQILPLPESKFPSLLDLSVELSISDLRIFLYIIGLIMYVMLAYANVFKIATFLSDGVKNEFLSQIFFVILLCLFTGLFFWIQKVLGFFSDRSCMRICRPILFALVICVMAVLAFSDLLISNKYAIGCDARAQRECDDQSNYSECYDIAYSTCDE